MHTSRKRAQFIDSILRNLYKEAVTINCIIHVKYGVKFLLSKNKKVQGTSRIFRPQNICAYFDPQCVDEKATEGAPFCVTPSNRALHLQRNASYVEIVKTLRVPFEISNSGKGKGEVYS